MSKWIWLLALLLPGFAFSETKKNVILITLDGVRWQEFYHGVDHRIDPKHGGEKIFEKLGELTDPHSLVLGPESKCQTITVANWVKMSLPGYQSIFSGRFPLCFSNSCARITTPTLFEGLTEKGFAKKDIALFASWNTIDHAAISHMGKYFYNDLWNHNIGLENFPHPTHAKLNQAQGKDPTLWGNARKDRYTFEHAMLYLEREKPRFLTLSLLDSDEWGHLSQYDEYVNSLRTYDTWISELVERLGRMGEYGRNTTIIVTTDHGRGSDPDNWGEHGYQKGGGKIWMWTYNYSATKQDCLLPWSHFSIRPFIQRLLLTPARERF